jgi:hypothetical protein
VLSYQLRDSVQIRSLAQKIIINMSSVANKTFRNNKTGESLKVIDAFENIAILENKQKIDVRLLLDPAKFTEQIDPSQFFNNEIAYSQLVEKIKNIPTNNIIDESINDAYKGIKPNSDESAIIYSSKQEEIEELNKKYGISSNQTAALERQQQAFSKYLDDSEGSTQTERVERIDITSEQKIHPPSVSNTEDPIITMFKNVKRNIDFKISLSISNKIPRIDFIEMMEDSYETSIIEFLSNEFTKKLLENPDSIKSVFKTEIKKLVYGDNEFKSERIGQSGLENIQTNSKEKSKKEQVRKNSKLSVKDRIEIINKLNSVSSIELQIQNERSKGVINAAKKRINSLNLKQSV